MTFTRIVFEEGGSDPYMPFVENFYISLKDLSLDHLELCKDWILLLELTPFFYLSFLPA